MKSVEISDQNLTILDVIRCHLAKIPDKNVYHILRKNVSIKSISFKEIDTQCKAFALYLNSLEIVKGDRVLLLFPSNIEFVIAFIGCLYAGVIAVPAPLPLKQQKKWDRTHSIAKDAGVRGIFTTEDGLSVVRDMLSSELEGEGVVFASFDHEKINEYQRPSTTSHESFLPVIKHEDIAFLQYTSGSTGLPKGVMVSHKNLLHNEELLKVALNHHQNTVLVSWLPLFHDMGLIGNVLHTLYLGATCYLMTPVMFLQDPYFWLESISKFKATSTFAPNFAFDLCVKKISEEQRNTLDLSSWKMALNGAEPIHYETLERFSHFFEPAGFRNTSHVPAYGLAEATLFVSATHVEGPPMTRQVNKEALSHNKIVDDRSPDTSLILVSSGVVTSWQEIRIVDPHTHRQLPDNQVGEIWISGDSVAKGYWQKPQATEETFEARVEGDDQEKPFLRTGDLGFIEGGNLYITGRLKDVIIVKGANYYPQDIEKAVSEASPAFRQSGGAAFGVVSEDGSENVVIVQEVERVWIRKLNYDEAIALIRKTIMEKFEIPVCGVVLIKPMTLPLTSSGKVQRRLCKSLFQQDSEEETFKSLIEWRADASSKMEDTRNDETGMDHEADPHDVITWISHWVKKNVPSGGVRISRKTIFAEIGLDSIKSVELASDIGEKFNIDVPPTIIWQYPTMGNIADFITDARKGNDQDKKDHFSQKMSELNDLIED